MRASLNVVFWRYRPCYMQALYHTRGICQLWYTFTMECIFCKISHKQAPATVIYEDDICMVIKTIEPVSAGHALVIPRHHFDNILDIEDSVLAHLALIAKKVGKQLVTEHAANGMNLLHAAGASAQQSVFHFHFHVVPRYEDDGLDLWFRNSL
jgi:histidine triad (HIT) family protein